MLLAFGANLLGEIGKNLYAGEVMSITFAQMGFASTVTARSATPATDGYAGEFQGLPYHIHPTETPGPWAALNAAIAANEVMVEPYVAPSVTPPTQAQLLACVGAKIEALLGAPRAYASATTPSVTIKSNATAATLANLQALQKWGAANPSSTTVWLDDDFAGVTVTGAQIVDIGDQVGAYALTIYGREGAAVVAAIGAAPATITTVAEIDAYPWTV